MAEQKRQAEELRERKAREDAERAEKNRIYFLPENVAARAAKQKELDEQFAAAEAEAKAKKLAAEAKEEKKEKQNLLLLRRNEKKKRQFREPKN